MATPRTTIDALGGAATPLDLADLFVVQQGGVTRKATYADLTSVLEGKINDATAMAAVNSASISALETADASINDSLADLYARVEALEAGTP